METLQNKIDTLLEQGIAPTVAIVRVGEDERARPSKRGRRKLAMLSLLPSKSLFSLKFQMKLT